MILRALAGIVALTVLPGAQVTVPEPLVRHAAGPVEFAMALARAGVPSGLEVHEADDVLPHPFPEFPRTGSRVSAAVAIGAFNAKNPRYRAVLADGVVVIRPIDKALRFLDQPAAIGSDVKIVGVMAAARRLFAPIAPCLLGPVLGSGTRAGEDLSLRLDGTGRTVMETLNHIVKQQPRTWVVTLGKDLRPSSIGYMEADHSRNIQGLKCRA